MIAFLVARLWPTPRPDRKVLEAEAKAAQSERDVAARERREQAIHGRIEALRASSRRAGERLSR